MGNNSKSRKKPNKVSGFAKKPTGGGNMSSLPLNSLNFASRCEREIEDLASSPPQDLLSGVKLMKPKKMMVPVD